MREYAPEGRRHEYSARADRAVEFIRGQHPRDTQEQVFKMLGLSWGGASQADIARERRGVLALQRADGGWAQLSSMATDAYATGQALWALHEAVLASESPEYRRGADYLLRTQLEDGAWFVRTRAFGFQPYFETGFPHGRSQFISTVATAWASLALALSPLSPLPRSTAQER